MKWQVLGLLIFTAAVFSGCAGTTPVSPASLPDSYGPLAHDEEVMGKIDELFEDRPPVRRPGFFTVPQLRTLARKTRGAPMAVFECDLLVLKAFIASNWVPIVVLGPPNGPKHLGAVVGYDDTAGEFTVFDSENNTQRGVKYARFFNLLVGPQKACLLMFSRYVGPEHVRRILKNYLPEERADKIPIRTPRGN